MAPPLPILPEETTIEEKKRNNQNIKAATIIKKAQKVKFRKRYSTLKKKAEELVTLCDTEVCLVCFGPDGKFYTSPEEKKNVKDTIMEFRKNGNCIKEFDLLGFLEDKKKKLERKKNNVAIQEINNLFTSWNEKIEELSEQELVNFDNYLENKLQVLTERSRLLEEEEDAIQFCDEGQSGPSLLNSPYSFDLCDTNNLNVDQQSCNPLLPLGSGTDCSYNQMMSLNDETLATNCGIISTWPLGYYGDVGCSSSGNGTTSLLGVSDSNTGLPENFDWMDYNHNYLLRENNDIILPNNIFPTEFAHTNTSFEIPDDFPLEFAQTNTGFNTGFGIPENFDEIGNLGYKSNCDANFGENFEVYPNYNLLPNNDTPSECAQITTDFGTVKNSGLIERSNNNFLFNDHAVSSQLSPLHCVLPRSVWQSSDGTKGNC